MEKLKRIERLQKQLHDLSVWKLTKLGEQRDKLNAAHVEMVRALGDGLLAFGGAAAAATRRIRSLEMEITATDAAHAEQAKYAFAQGARSKMAEQVVGRARDESRREAEKKTLSELIDQSLSAAVSGSRKL